MKLRFFEYAKKAAGFSSHQFHHGAVLVRGGKVIKTSFNDPRPIKFTHKHHHAHRGSLHAEIGVLLNLTKDKTKGADIYVCRVLKDGTYRNSKPCSMCQIIAQEMGIKRIKFTTDKGFDTIQL